MKILSYFKAQILLILIIFAAQPYQAQITEEDFKNPLKNLIPPSPTAAALAEYADVPVSEYTGIPSIQIPIYNYSSGTLDLPINLSYHASGIKVDEVASWVGLGWSLNAGGMITKSIRGLEDNVPNGYQDNPIFNTFDGTVLDLYNNAPEVEAMMRGDLDGEPDIYYFNFNGNSGKFVFDHNDQIRLIPHSDLKIERDLSLGFGEQGFIITDTKGIKYYFGGQYKERTYTSVVSGPNSQGPCVGDFSPPQNGGLTGWYLYKIEDPISEDYIELDYLPYTIDFDQGMNANAYMDNPVSIGAHESICVNAPGNTECITHQSSQSHSLSRITSNSGISIEFKRDSQRDDVMGGVKLNSIELFDRSGGLMKWFNLSYDYMISAGAYPGNHEMSKRLKLRSVEEKTSLISKPPYILEYTDDLSSTQKLPLRLSYAQDHWGFYNGKNQNNTMLPKRVYHHHGFEGSDRDANPSTVTAGMLSKIIYPTGGNVSFDFECNDIGYFSSSSILNWNSFYSNKQVEIEAYRDVNGGSAYAHIIDTFYIPYALEATYSIETRNDQLGTNEWNGNIWVTHLESGQGACLFQGGRLHVQLCNI
ncbi:MAG: hypothetical protein MRY83_06260 [Flavobacteriales bacterium]|nr:hypothetical protein [Flavobacteriales bacterium]